MGDNNITPKKIKHIVYGIIIGGVSLFLFSMFQKALIGVNIFIIQGYYIPFCFGTTAGGLVGYLNYKSKKFLESELTIKERLGEKMDAEIQRKTSKLELAKETIDLLNEILLHDIKNDLTSIYGYLQLFMKSNNVEYLNHATKGITQCDKLLDRMRELKILTETEQNLRKINLNQLLKECKEKYPIEIKITGGCDILADDTLSSVFSNLILNSIEHGKVNLVEIEIKDYDE